MIKLSKKAVIITLALIAVIATAGTAFAYWASGFNGTNNSTTATIQIGSGGTVNTELALDAMSGGGALIPAGRQAGENETNSVAYTCNVVWTSTDDESALSAANVTGTLSVALTNIKIGSDDFTEGELPFAVSIKAGASAASTSFTITGDTPLALTFTFIMNEPSKEQYGLIAGKSVVFTFAFTVADVVSA